jgi:hypothetical protein
MRDSDSISAQIRSTTIPRGFEITTLANLCLSIPRVIAMSLITPQNSPQTRDVMIPGELKA